MAVSPGEESVGMGEEWTKATSGRWWKRTAKRGGERGEWHKTAHLSDGAIIVDEGDTCLVAIGEKAWSR